MITFPGGSEPGRHLGDRLAEARRRHFVGREEELGLFRAALRAPEPPFAVLYVHGLGGIGKTALLHAFARVATEHRRPVVYLDGRDVEPSPAGFSLALHQALGLPGDATSAPPPAWPADGVLLLDTYERLSGLDAWLRADLFPSLPVTSLVVIADRGAPAPPWRTEGDWAALTRLVPLRNLSPGASREYLAIRGVPSGLHAGLLAVTHGHPLALVLAAEVLRRGQALGPLDPLHEPELIRLLVERLVQDIPSPSHRLALGVCVLAPATTESLLAEVLGPPNAHELFGWLRDLTFMEEGGYGVFPHDLAREVLDADLQWRDPAGHRELRRKLSVALEARVQQERGIDQQRAWSDFIYLHRHNPFYAPYFDWSLQSGVYVEAARPHDAPAIVGMVQQHQGDASAGIAQHWLHCQPDAFSVYRDHAGDPFGFMAQVRLHLATPEDLARDPGAVAVLRYMERHGPLRAGEEAVYLRFWMSQEHYQRPSPAVNLTAINSSIYWTTHPRLAWNFITVADPVFFEPHFTGVHMWRAPEADFLEGGRSYGVFAHDWRAEPASAWLDMKAELAARTERSPASDEEIALPFLVLSREEFAGAVCAALRDYTRPGRLAENPLARSRLVAAHTATEPGGVLQSLLRAALATLAGSPKETKKYRAVWHTYFEPAPTQEAAAELLGIPFNTYRYRLHKGTERIIDVLWQHDLDGTVP